MGVAAGLASAGKERSTVTIPSHKRRSEELVSLLFIAPYTHAH